tara:strand:- start:48 stop:1040 length:993 start_codon:yes stop_codon:yes gene_type:complete
MSMALIGAATNIVGGLIQGFGAKDKARAAQRRYRKAEQAFNNLKRQRQDLSDLGALARDRSGDITNPFANIGVATQAAEFQAEEADVALANTLDTLRATGAGAGGATALAQAALRSKRDIGASIEKQEIQNQVLRAQGQAKAEVARAQIGAQADALKIRGRSFTQQMREARQFRDEDRAAALLDQSRAQMMQAREASQAGFASALGSLGGIALGGLVGGKGSLAKAFGLGGNTTPDLTSTQVDLGFDPGNVGTNTSGRTSFFSDRRLKKDIKFLKLSPSGLKIYSFKYINGNKTYQGVMSDEIPQSAVKKDIDGFDLVDYSQLDVEFKQI